MQKLRKKMWLRLVILFISALCCHCRFLDEGCIDLAEIPMKVVPPKVISVTGKGHFYSPNFGTDKSYPDSVQCSYQLQAPAGMHVRLKFNHMDIEVTDACQADAVSVFDFDSQGQGILLAMLCGNIIPNDYVSTSHALQVVLKTDAFGGKGGFNISYSVQSTSSVCPSGQKTCRNRNCVDYLLVCDGKDDCGDGTDEEKCSSVLPTTECGKSDVEHEIFSDVDRIVGGKEAIEGSWPWVADLQAKYFEPNGHTCGGVLINAQWVLSAAHCFGDLRRPEDWRIHLGNHGKFQRDVGEQVRYVERIIIYNDIPPSVFERNGEFDIVHDIALLKLNAPVKFTKYVKPVCLPSVTTQLSRTSRCYAVGWGATRGTGGSDVLKQSYHPVQSDVLCQRLVGNQFDPSTMICAGKLTPLDGVCHGDSGGPLLCEENGTWSVVGVASYVTDGTGTEGLCGLRGRPSVFNKISAKLGYIKRMINRYS